MCWYCHQLLQGTVAARRVELVHLTASNCSIGYWNYAFMHSVDILNRTTGPPESKITAYEAVTGKQPKVLPIMPFGCRAIPVQPRSAIRKTFLDNKGLLGVNLGKVPSIPNAYYVMIPRLLKIMIASDVHFDETLMPWREKGDQRVGPVVAIAAPQDYSEDPPKLSSQPSTQHEGESMASSTPESLAEAFDQSQRRAPSARRSNRVLILFSGPYNRPDGLAVFLKKMGMECDLVDSDPENGGDATHDILSDSFFHELQTKVSSGHYCCIFAAPPCSTFSVSRFMAPKSGKPGPPPVRVRNEILGLEDVPAGHTRELARANGIVDRLCTLLTLAHDVGSQFIIENPQDRGDRAYPTAFLHKDHGPIWLMPNVVSLIASCSTSSVHFPQCMFNAKTQKRTTLMYTAGLESWLGSLRKVECTHSSHEAMAGGYRDEDGVWCSAETAAYPPDLNLFLAKSIASLHVDPFLKPNLKSTDAAPPQMVKAKAISEIPSFDPIRTTSKPVNKPVAPPPSPARQLNFADGMDAPAGPDQSVLPSAKKIHFERAGHPLREALRPRHGKAALALSGGLLLLGKWRNGGHGKGKAKLATPSSTDPRNFKHAMRMDETKWRASTDIEFGKHIENKSFKWRNASEKPANRRLVNFTWVFKTKRDGTAKSRLCVQGCSQVLGLDYDQTYCATMRPTSLRLLSALAAKHGMTMRRWDFVTAYLQGSLLDGEVVWCRAPEGYERKGTDGLPMVCEVIKPIYGMAQAGRRWQRSLFPWLTDLGFRAVEGEPCVFECEREMSTPSGPRLERLLLGVYVDDIAAVYSHDDEHSLYQHFVSSLSRDWQAEDEGELSDLLGVEFNREKDKVISLSQPAYITKMAEAYFTAENPNPELSLARCPCDKNIEALVAMALGEENQPSAAEVKAFQSIVGALLYAATNTRPDVAYAVGMLCRAMSRPTPELMSAALRVLGYLDRTKHLGLRYEASDKELYGMSDSDWAVKHSTTGWVFMFQQAAISWGSKKQNSVALSSCEAEIMAASEASKEAIHLDRMAKDLKMSNSEPLDLFVDNQSAIAVAYNPELHQRTKHIERRHYFVREVVEAEKIRVPYVKSADNIADFFTKPLQGDKFFSMRDKIMNIQG